MTTRQTNKRRKKPTCNVSLAKHANLVLNVKNAHHVTQHMKRPHKLHLQPQPPLALACHASKRSACRWPTCKPWRKAVAWSGSTPTPSAWQPYKRPLPPSPSLCMCRVSVHLRWCWMKVR